MQRLKRRARGEELGVSLDYLTSLHDKHEKWLSKVRNFRAPAARTEICG